MSKQVESIMGGASVLSRQEEAGPIKDWWLRRKAMKGNSTSFKSCNGFYKDGQCFRDRAAWRATKKRNKNLAKR